MDGDKSMNISDNELGMLEMLCYLDENLLQVVDGEFNDSKNVVDEIQGQKKTVNQLLDSIHLTEEAIEKLAACGNTEIPGAYAEASEWASILKYIRSSELGNLTLGEMLIDDGNGGILAMSFYDEDNPTEAVVAFKGTASAADWLDNVNGLNQTDTEAQIEALNFIEGLPYTNITVTGHSKGGNKAMYATILSNKVTRCVSFDGQGFSEYFMEKYWFEIQTKGNLIKNYSVATDFVHILLFPIPNSQQIYCQGNGIGNIAQNHSPNTFFLTDENGNLILDANGIPIIVEETEAESMAMLHDFVSFVMNNGTKENKESIAAFLGPLFKLILTTTSSEERRKQKQEELKALLTEQNEGLFWCAAFLIKYIDTCDLKEKDVKLLVETLGLKSLEEVLLEIGCGPMVAEGTSDMAAIVFSALLEGLTTQLNDGNKEVILTNHILPLIQMFCWSNFPMDVSDIWERLDSMIAQIDYSAGCSDYPLRETVVRRFTLEVYDALRMVMHGIEIEQGITTTEWENYADEEWYLALRVSQMKRMVSNYAVTINEINHVSKMKIEEVFQQVASIDNTSAQKLSCHNDVMMNVNYQLSSIVNGILG